MLGFSSNFSNVAHAQTANITLSGYVIDKNFKTPIDNAIVEIPSIGISVKTDGLGFYRIDNLTSDTYSVTAKAKRYLDKTISGIDVTQIDTSPWIRQDFEMVGVGENGIAKKLTKIFGTVYDRNTGVPLEGIKIDVTAGPFSTQVFTDDLGFYTTDELEAGTYIVTASSTGYNGFSHTATVVSGTPSSYADTIIDFYLKAKPFSFKGKVLGYLGKSTLEGLPFVRVEAKLFYDKGEDIFEIYKYAITDAAGNYILDDLPPGVWQINAMPEAYTAKSFDKVLNPGDTQEVTHDFEFKERATINVKLKSSDYSDDFTLPNGEVKLRTLTGMFAFSQNLQITKTSDANGIVTFDYLPTAQYEITASEMEIEEATFYPGTVILNTIFADDPPTSFDKELDLSPRTNILAGTTMEKNGIYKSGLRYVESSPRLLHPIISDPQLEERLVGPNPEFAKYPHCFDGWGMNIVQGFGFEEPYDCWEPYIDKVTELEGAKIKIKKLEFAGREIDLNKLDETEFESNKDGKYAVTDLLPGKYTIEIKKPGLLKKEIEVKVTSFKPPTPPSTRPEIGIDRDFILYPPKVNVYGKVYGVLYTDGVVENRIPLLDAKVSLTNSKNNFEVTTDENGFYFIENIPWDYDSTKLASGDLSADDVTPPQFNVQISAGGYQTLSSPNTVVPAFHDGIVYSKNLLKLDNPGTLTITEAFEYYAEDPDTGYYLSNKGPGFSNRHFFTLYDNESGFMASGGTKINSYAKLKPLDQPMGESFTFSATMPDSAKWKQPSPGTYVIQYHKGSHEFEVVARGDMRADDHELDPYPFLTPKDVAIYRAGFGSEQGSANLKQTCYSGANCKFEFAGSGVTKIHMMNPNIPGNPVDYAVDYNLHGYAYNWNTGEPVEEADVLLKMSSEGRCREVLKPFSGCSVKYGQVPGPLQTSPFELFDHIEPADKGRFKLEGTFSRIPEFTTDIPPEKHTRSWPLNMPWNMELIINNAPGYDDATETNGMKLHPGVYGSLPTCGTTYYSTTPSGCPTDFDRKLRFYLFPHGLIKFFVYSNENEEVTLETKTAKGPDDDIPTDIFIKINENPNTFPFPNDYTKPNQLNAEPLENGDYTFSIRAKKHYPISIPADNIALKKVTISNEKMHPKVAIRLEPIPDPKLVEDSFFVFYPNNVGGISESDDKKREITGYVLKGFKNPFTDDAKWKVKIDRGKLRENYEDPVIKVDLVVKPKAKVDSNGNFVDDNGNPIGAGQKKPGVCERDQNVTNISELTKTFPGRFVGGEIDGVTSDKNKISVWQGEVDPEHDLPCGELEFTFDVITLNQFYTKTEDANYNLRPSYPEPYLNVLLTIGAWGDDVKPSFLQDSKTGGIKYVTSLIEFEIGDLQINLLPNNEQLKYEVSKFSLKVKFADNKSIKGWLNAIGIYRLKPPDIGAEFEKVTFSGNDGLYNGQGKVEIEIGIDDSKQDQEKKKKLQELMDDKKFKRQLQSYTKLKIKGAPSIDYKAKLSYEIAHKNVQGVDDAAFKVNPLATAARDDGIKETLGGALGVEAQLKIPLLTKVVQAALPPAAPAVQLYETLGGPNIDLVLKGVVEPSMKVEQMLKKWLPGSSPWRVQSPTPPPKIGFGMKAGPSAGIDAFEKLAFSLGGTGALSTEHELEQVISQPVPVSTLNMKKATLEFEGVAKVKVWVAEKEFKTDKYKAWEKTWKSESVAYDSTFSTGWHYGNYEMVATTTDTPTDIILIPPADGGLLSGTLREKVHPSPTISIDANDQGSIMMGYVQQDTAKPLPNNLQAESMLFDQTTHKWNDAIKVHDSIGMPDIEGAMLSFYEPGKVIAIWSTLEKSISEPFELIQAHNNADIQYAIYDTATKTWSESKNLTDDKFIDMELDVSKDEITGKVVATWIQDKDGSILTFDDNAIYHAIWNGNDWSVPELVLDNANALKTSIAFDDGVGAIAYSEKSDTNISNVKVIKFANTWGSPILLSDGPQASKPQVEIKDGRGFVIWVQHEDEHIFPVIYYNEFTKPSPTKQQLTKTDTVLDISSSKTSNSILTAWSTHKANSTQIVYSKFDGTNWNSYQATERYGTKVPLIDITGDASNSMHVAYYNQTGKSYDLAFFSTTLTGNELPKYIAPIEPGELPPESDTSSEVTPTPFTTTVPAPTPQPTPAPAPELTIPEAVTKPETAPEPTPKAEPEPKKEIIVKKSKTPEAPREVLRASGTISLSEESFPLPERGKTQQIVISGTVKNIQGPSVRVTIEDPTGKTEKIQSYIKNDIFTVKKSFDFVDKEGTYKIILDDFKEELATTTLIINRPTKITETPEIIEAKSKEIMDEKIGDIILEETQLKQVAPFEIKRLKAKGTVPDYQRGGKIEISFEKPDGNKQNYSVLASKDGVYSTLLTITDAWTPGEYKVTAIYQGNQIGSNILTITGIITPSPTIPKEPSMPSLEQSTLKELVIKTERVIVSGNQKTDLVVSGHAPLVNKPTDVAITLLKPDASFDTLTTKTDSVGNFEITISFDKTDEAGRYAIKAKTERTDIGSQNFTVEIQAKDGPTEKVPSWVKTNVKWWSDQAIPDESFLEGIQYMIKEDIIHIEEIPETTGTQAESAVPDWIRNNAAWWSDGLISEDEFIQAIQFLIKEGAIRID